MNIASMIDHTNLKATATQNDIKKLCEEASSSGFASVCVNPVNVKYAASLLNHKDSKGSTGNNTVAVCTVIGFPLGASSSKVKAFEATCAIEDGATEVDMVIDIGAAKEGRWDDVESDIRQVVEASRTTSKKCNSEYGVIVKVIIEICYLNNDQIIEACKRAVKAGADFVKTSTGFGTPGKDKDGNSIPNGATTERVSLMRKTVGSDIGVKAAGGIRDKETTLEMINAGASRIGTSAGIAIIS